MPKKISKISTNSTPREAVQAQSFQKKKNFVQKLISNQGMRYIALVQRVHESVDLWDINENQEPDSSQITSISLLTLCPNNGHFYHTFLY